MAATSELSANVMTLWERACQRVSDGGEAFRAAYAATLAEVYGRDWKKRWMKDEAFETALHEVEAQMRQICRSKEMALATFNQYKLAARKAVLLGVSFSMGRRLNVPEIRNIQRKAHGNKELAESLARQARQHHGLQTALNQARRVSAVLPLPMNETKEEYLLQAVEELVRLGRAVEERFGQRAARNLFLKALQKLVQASDQR